MAELDELLARADEEAAAFPHDPKRHHLRPLIGELAAALRAALAARPQPLFEGTIEDAWRWLDTDLDHDPEQRVVVYPAAAGPATPTGDDDE